VPFGKYLLLDRISVGGMAEVFKAKSYGVEGFEKIIAIKRILPSMGDDRDFIKMFIDEAKIAGQLTHANICQIFELGRIDGAHFIAMEYIWGKDLLQIQNRLRKLKQIMPVPMACYVLAKVCEGLDYAHRKRDAMGRPLEIVHRDCSPQNVLISYEGEVKLIDFGIAKAASRSSRTVAGVLKGKFGYMSPEQVRGLPLDRRSDVFALGTMLYECLTGERLFQGETDFATLEKVRNVDIAAPRKLNPALSEEVEAIILKALAKDVEDRYQWCSELHADLVGFLRRQEGLYTPKTLATWVKEVFAQDIGRERQQLESYKKLGKDGLIAGVPAAKARVDVLQQFGPAGTADDPTTLGAPQFDDLVSEDERTIDEARKSEPDFEAELPTSIYGEIAEAELPRASTRDEPPLPNVLVRQTGQVPALTDAPPGVATPPSPPAAMRVGRSTASSPVPPMPSAGAAAGGRAAAVPMAASAAPVTKTLLGMPAMAIGTPAAMPPNLAATPATTPVGGSPVASLGTGPNPLAPRPRAASVATATGTRRPSLGKDVAIGVGIAAAVLTAFAVGRFVIFSDSAPKVAAAVGAVVVTVGDGAPADVFVNDQKRGALENGRLQLDRLAAGRYQIRVERAGASPCTRDVDVAAGDTATIHCELGPAAVATAPIAPVAPPAPTEPPTAAPPADSPPASAHRLHPGSTSDRDRDAVRGGDGSGGDPPPTVEMSAAPSGKAKEAAATDDAAIKPASGDDSEEPPPPADDEAAAKGFLVAYTSPWARLLIDDVDTGKSTPIRPPRKIPLAAGKHRLTFVVNDQSVDYWITITAGKTLTFNKDLPIGGDAPDQAPESAPASDPQ